MTVTEPALFRQEVILASARQPLGSVSMALPLAHLTALSLLGAVVVLLGVFLTTCSYVRKETVVGYLTTTGGTVHVFPAFSGGTLLALNVAQDDEVMRGDVLALVSAQQPLEGGGHLGEELQKSLAARHRALAEERERTKGRFKALRAAHENALTTIQAEIGSARHTQSLRRQSLELMNNRTQALQRLHANGNISDLDWLSQLSDALNVQAAVSDFDSQLIRLKRQAAIETATLAELPRREASALADLQRQQSEIKQRQTEIRSRDHMEIRSPVDGRVVVVRARTGTQTRSDVPLLTIRPRGSKLEVRLLVPTTAIGFIEPGQQLRVMYDAFPYQHFGTHRARVVSVANDLVYAGEDTGPFNINTHAYLTHAYLAIAQLESETIETNNRSIPLRHGMSLKADILLEKRTLLNWLLEPIHSLRRRT